MAATKPNIIVILTDDQGPWAMGCAGNTEIRTPNLDRIAAEGIRFTNFFCSSPVCSPARASIVTGRIPSQHGVHDWIKAGNTVEKYEPDGKGEQIEYLAGMPGYTDFLSEAGYTCGLSGKWHLGACHTVQKSYDYWNVHAKGGGPYYNAPMVRGNEVYEEENYVTDVITDHALEFLDSLKEDAPFYLGVHYTAPHSPWGREHHPKETFDDYYKNCPFESVPVEQRNAWHANGLYPTSMEDRRHVLSGYFTAVTEMDRNVGRILERLEQMGVSNDTLILFLSDNGMNMGHHGTYGKGNGTFPQNMYDTSVKIPALIRWPAVIKPGRVSEAMLSQYDVMPTFLDAVGMVNPAAESLPGCSFLPILQDEKESVRDDVVIYDEYGPVRMIRTADWKYVHRYPYGPHELYDLEADPDEKINLVANPEQQDRIREMKRGLESWFAKYTDPAVDGRIDGVTGLGQLHLAGLKGEGRRNFNPRG
jgi:choline-sulfatase